VDLLNPEYQNLNQIHTTHRRNFAMVMIIYICLATATTCGKQNAVQVIHVPMQQLAINCGFQAQSYAIQNGIELTGLVMNAQCKLGGG
jgi:hypothetical protein